MYRSFFDDALKRAIKYLCRSFNVDEDPRLDKYTQGLPGGADIVASIERKIDCTHAFILAQQLRSIPRQFRKMCRIVVGTAPAEYKI